MENEQQGQGLSAGDAGCGRGLGLGSFLQREDSEVKFPLSPLHMYVMDLAVESQFFFVFLTDFTKLIRWKI